MRDDVIKMILANLRLPYETNGDIWAQIKALDLGERRLHALFGHGVWSRAGRLRLVQDHAEEIFYARVDEIPDGSAEFEDYMDVDPLDPERRPVQDPSQADEGRGDISSSTSAAPIRSREAGRLATPRSRSPACTSRLMNLFPDLPFNNGFVATWRS